MPKNPRLALLLDVDGPVASPVTRRVQPGIIADLLGLASQGVPIVFNTGRSDSFIREQVMMPMQAAGIAPGVTIHAVCEKGAVWFNFTNDGAGTVHIDDSLSVPGDYATDIRRLVAEDYASHMFFDETKRAMVSVEQQLAVSSDEYLAQQRLFDADALKLMSTHQLVGAILDHHASGSDDAMADAAFRLDPTIISTDIESVRLGKDLGASRAVELLAQEGITPQSWRTVGDSRTDYAMADWLHHNDHDVKHVDVRPADGVPVKPYPVLTAADLGLGADVIHDDAGAAFLAAWRKAMSQ
ncbi:MAG: hypothetical protein HIU81_01420 [Acidobacteria bacterium]|nr:hypothetical protein [Acidobacteriota bacterium]